MTVTVRTAPTVVQSSVRPETLIGGACLTFRLGPPAPALRDFPGSLLARTAAFPPEETSSISGGQPPPRDCSRAQAIWLFKKSHSLLGHFLNAPVTRR